jgi:uncharacterized protein with PQ loop repeat
MKKYCLTKCAKSKLRNFYDGVGATVLAVLFIVAFIGVIFGVTYIIGYLAEYLTLLGYMPIPEGGFKSQSEAGAYLMILMAGIGFVCWLLYLVALGLYKILFGVVILVKAQLDINSPSCRLFEECNNGK